MQTRIVALQRTLAKEQGVAVVVPGFDFRYLMGWSPLPDERLTVLVITKDQTVLLINGVNAEEARAHLAKQSVEVISFDDADDPIAAARSVFQRVGAETSQVCYLSQDARFDHSEILRQALNSAVRWQVASTLLGPARMAKDGDEVEALARSQVINDAVMRRAFEAIRPNISELELADVIRRAFADEGADRDAFVIVAFGEHAAHPHHAPDGTRIKEGPVLLDIGCFKDGYASDMTRMAYLGTPSERYLAVHEAVEQASRAGIAAVQVAAPVGQVDQASRAAIVQAGFGPYFVHRTGHGIGLEVHESPSVTSANPEPMQVGMAFSIEPGIYLPNQFGVRLEEVVIVQPHGARVLSKIPRAVHVVAV